MSLIPFGQVPTESNRPVAPPACFAVVAERLPLPDTPGRKETPDACPPLISDRTARNGLSVRPVRTGRPTRAVDLKSIGPHRLEHSGPSDLADESQPPILNPTTRAARRGSQSGRPLRKPLRDVPPRKSLSEPFGE